MKTYKEITEDVLYSIRDLTIENIEPNVVFMNSKELEVLEADCRIMFPMPTAEDAYFQIFGLKIIEYSGKTIVAKVNDKDTRDGS